jgi:hypothetical protein
MADRYWVSTNSTVSLGVGASTIFFKPDGLKLYTFYNTVLSEYNCSTAWDITTASFVVSVVPASQNISRSFWIDPTGTHFFLVRTGGSSVNQYVLGTPWDISTLSLVRNKAVNTNSFPHGIWLKPDGTKMYLGCSSSSVGLQEWDLSTPFDVSTASFVRNINPGISQGGLYFRDDGLKAYLTDQNNNAVREYNLGTAWNISTISLVTTFTPGLFSSAGQWGLFFKDDGSKMYIGSRVESIVFSIPISTPWSLSTAGGDTWNGVAGSKWAATSGGAGGESVPTSADNVFFDSNSLGAFVAIAAGNTGAGSINCTGFTGALSGNTAITVSGSITLVAGMGYTYTGALTFNGTGTLTTAGKTLSAVTVNGSGITVTLGDALNLSTNTLTVTQGTFDTSNYNLTANLISSNNANTRTISLGSSTITLAAATPVDFTNTTNLTFNAGTSQINCTNTTPVFNGNGLTYYNVTFTNGDLTAKTINGANTFNNLTANSTTTGLMNVVFSANQTVNGTFTAAGNSVINRVFVRSDVIGTTRTITAAALSANDCDFRDTTITGAAAGTTPTRAGDCGGNTGITFSSKTVYWNLSGTQNWNANAWATTANGSPNVVNFPLPQDTATFTNSGAAGTVNFGTVGYNFPEINASARTSAMTLGHNGAQTIYGSYTLGSGVTVSGTSAQTFSGVSTMTFTSAGKTITFPITVDTANGTFQPGDAIITSNSITHTRGTFNCNNFNLTCTVFASNNSNTRTITMGSGTLTLTSTGTVWNLTTTTNLTFNANTSNILLENTTTTARTFVGGGVTYGKLTIGGATGVSTLTITGANTFSELASTKTVAHTITFAENQTVGNWTIKGTAGNVVTINSSAAGTARTITKSGGGFLTGIDYINVRDIIGSPISDTWYIGANSVYNTTAPNRAQGFFLTQRVLNAIVVLTDTSGSGTWTVPDDWDDAANTIHLIGGGGGAAGGYVSGNNRMGGGGGGSGGYTQLTNQTLTIGASIAYQAGSGGSGGAANTNGTAGGTTSWNSGTATAGGGGNGQATISSSTGGTAGSGTTNNGGVGGIGADTSPSSINGAGAGGGAGAAGPNGVGKNGGNGATIPGSGVAGGGGGNGGGTNGGNRIGSSPGVGGNNSLGFGGGAANTAGTSGGGGGGGQGNPNQGGNGIDIFGVGSGGGGGGGDAAINSAGGGGLYGGGGGGGGVSSTGPTARPGGNGAQGAIIIVYTPVAQTSSSGMLFMIN